MGLHEGRGAVSKAMKTLENRWLEARFSWGDARAGEFEERFLLPLQNDLRDAVAAMDQMAVLVSRIRRECE